MDVLNIMRTSESAISYEERMVAGISSLVGVGSLAT